MKFSVPPVKAFLLTIVFILGGPLLAQDTTASAPAQPPSNAANSPADKATIPGFVIPRDKGGYLGLEIDRASNTFRLSFYDAKKKPVAPDAANAVISWYLNAQEKDKLVYWFSLDTGGKSLVSPRNIIMPLPHRAQISLTDSNAAPIESYADQDLSSLGG